MFESIIKYLGYKAIIKGDEEKISIKIYKNKFIFNKAEVNFTAGYDLDWYKYVIKKIEELELWRD